ncbi:unnamed protein product, partial [Iphiclides podalirius]
MGIKCISVIFFLLVFYYTAHSISNETDQRFAESESALDPNGALLLKWKVDYLSRKIHFQLIISERAPEVNWFALGFSDRGNLEYSDVCLVWTDYKGRDHFEDMHADSDGKLTPDNQQDCESFYFDGERRSVFFERYFDTCDDDDYIIDDGTVHVVWARGVDKLFSSKGLCLTCTEPQDHGFIRVRLLTPTGTPKYNGQQLRITNEELKVPSGDTTYWCKVVKLPNFINQNVHHIIKFESTITKGNEGLVHHMELFYCDADPKKEIPLYNGNCFSPERPDITKLCSKVRAAWAMGAPPFAYPEEAGLPIGGPNSNQYIMLEVHYNNPELKNDWVDSSGIILHLTPKQEALRCRYNGAWS